MMKTAKKIYMFLLFAFLYAPIFVMIILSFNDSKSRTIFTGFTFKWYEQLFSNEVILKSLVVTLIIAITSSIFATLLGTLAAVGINRMKKLSRKLVLNISYMPVLNPEIITGVSLLLLFAVVKNYTGSWVFGWPSLFIAHVTFNVPYVILSVLPKLRQMDERLYEAALDLGCNEKQAFFKVVLPEISPGIISGFLIAITYSIDDFVISYFTSGTLQTLPIVIFSMTRKKVSPEINALSTIMFVIVLAILLLINLKDISDEKKLNIKQEA
jgi:ABC-type spermidine/putrescine transport system, permease component II